MIDAKQYCMPVQLVEKVLPNPLLPELFLLYGEEAVSVEITFSKNTPFTFLLPKGYLLACSSAADILWTEKSGVKGLVVDGLLTREFVKGLEEKPGVFLSGGSSFLRLFEQIEKTSDEMQSALTYHLLMMLTSELKKGTSGAMPLLVQSAMEEIHAHYAELFGVEELADSLEVSKEHLIRKFKKVTGITPGQYLMEVRLEHAKRYLLCGFTLDMVAGMSGFSSASYFCKVFKKSMAESPEKWRSKQSGTKAFKPQNSLEEDLFLLI